MVLHHGRADSRDRVSGSANQTAGDACGEPVILVRVRVAIGRCAEIDGEAESDTDFVCAQGSAATAGDILDDRGYMRGGWIGGNGVPDQAE